MNDYVMSEEEISRCGDSPSVLTCWQMAPHFWEAGIAMLEATAAHLPVSDVHKLDMKAWADLSVDERHMFVMNLVVNKVMLQCGAWVSGTLIFGGLNG